MNNEDMKILEERVTTLKRHIKNYEESDCKTDIYHQLVKECKAIENLLTRYKQLEEENKKWEEWAENAECDMSTNFIRKSKVKEKIEELARGKNDDWNNEYFIEGRKKEAKMQVLQELLES